jgi:outer membrane translocation and assembly module TamA
MQAMFYQPVLGSDHSFQQYLADYRRFLPIHGEYVLALQLHFLSSRGDVPWQMLGRLGGFELMRGYQDNKYRGAMYGAGQLEFRFPILWRVGGVVFGAAGEVADSIDGFSARRLKLAYGLGLRGVVDWEEHIAFRLDVAFDDARNPNVYFGLLEAF